MAGVGRIVRIAVAILAVAVQVYGLYRPAPPPSEPWFPNADKLEHAVGFALPVLCCLLALGRFRWLVPAAFAGHAVLSELIQGAFYRYRSADPIDALADACGIGIGAGGYLLVTGRQRARGRTGR